MDFQIFSVAMFVKFQGVYGGFLKWWYPTTMGFPTKNDHFGVFGGYHHLRKPPYISSLTCTGPGSQRMTWNRPIRIILCGACPLPFLGFLDEKMGFSMFFGAAKWMIHWCFLGVQCSTNLMGTTSWSVCFKGPWCFFWVVGKHLWQLFCFLFNSQDR